MKYGSRSRLACAIVLAAGWLSSPPVVQAGDSESSGVTNKAPSQDRHAAFAEVSRIGLAQFEAGSGEKHVPVPFQQDSHEFRYEAKFVRFSGPVRVFDVTFPSPIETEIESNNTVHGQYFQPAGAGPFPGVVVLHILGGEFALSQMIANALARQGVGALFIKMPYYGERRSPESRRRMISRDPHETVESMTQAVLDIRRAATWLEHRPEIADDRLGVTGISLGGIMSALSAAAEPRFRKVAIYLGGGKLAESLWELDHPDARRFRAQWLADGGTRASFVRTLMPVDPVTYGHLLKDRQVLLVAAKNDEIIPPAATVALWESMGQVGELIWLDAGHITAAKYLLGEVQRLGRFFAETDWKNGTTQTGD
jgi:dienelactone hydrolase